MVCCNVVVVEYKYTPVAVNKSVVNHGILRIDYRTNIIKLYIHDFLLVLFFLLHKMGQAGMVNIIPDWGGGCVAPTSLPTI